MTSDQKEQLQSVAFYTLNINIKHHQTLNLSSLWLQLTGQLKIPRKGLGEPVSDQSHSSAQQASNQLKFFGQLLHS